MAKGKYARASLEDRFKAKIKAVDSGCHEWQSTLHRDGYGKIWVVDRQVQAHRVAYQLYKGEVPDGLLVLHICDNRKCVNPEHLYLGDAKQNTADKIARCGWYGNMQYQFETIEKIREMYKTGNYSQQQLADIFKIHQTQVSKYVRNKQRVNK